MWHFHNIPKILHLYWGTSRPLPYLRYLTVETFIKHNPDWKIKVYHCSEVCNDVTWTTGENTNIYRGKDYFPLLKNFESVELIEKVFLTNFLNGAHDIHKSDFTRWEVLYQNGGFWSDFDILYLQPMNNLFENKSENSSADNLLCVYRKERSETEVFPIGFFGGKEKSSLFKECFNGAPLEYIKEKYECMGAKHLRRTVYKGKHTHTKISDECVYPIFYKDLEQVLKDNKIIFKSNTVGFHWYAGSNLMFNIEEIKKFLELFLKSNI